MRILTPVRLALLISLLFASPLTARQTPSEVFRDRVDVRVLNLEIAVQDAQGRHVSGLGPEDFRILVDGEPVPIRYFSEIENGRATAVPEGSETDPAISSGERVGRSYVVFIDEFFSLPEDRDAVIEALIGDLEGLEPGDQMAIVAWDGRELAKLSHWSSSSSHLRSVLRAALDRPADGRSRWIEQSPVGTPNTRGRESSIAQNRRHRIGAIVMSDAALDNDLDTVPDVESMRELDLRMTVERLERQMHSATSAAAGTLRAFASAPGRKIMLLLSGGWPHSPAELLADNAPTELLDFFTDSEAVFGHLPVAANRLGFTIYSIDVPDSTMRGSATSMTEGSGGFQSDQESTPQDANPIATGTDMRKGMQMRQTLERLSRPTGGRVLTAGDRTEALSMVARDTSSYYWIGFTPSWQEDDRAREIRVEMRTEGLRARTRTSYLDISARQSTTMLLESALLFDTPVQQDSVPVKVGDGKRARRGMIELPISVAVPVDGVVFLEKGRQFVAELSLHLSLRDDEGNTTADIDPIPFEIRIDGSPKAGTYVRYDTRIQIRNRPHRLALAIHDRTGGATLTGSANIDP